MTDSVDTLAGASGIRRAVLLELWEIAKENGARLKACRRHDFVPTDPGMSFGQRFRCRACGGEADGVAVKWYEEGLAHGGS